MNNILLTGATGVVGSAILNELAKNRDNTIYLLTRAKDAQNLAERLKDVYAFFSLDPADPRLIPIMGDISEANLGMGKDELTQLSKKIDTVIHSAANVKMNQTIEEARLNALTGTKALFEFSNSCDKLQRISYISTLGVNGKSQKILEETYPPENVLYHNTYEQAKAESEFYIFDKWYHSLPVVIIRPSMVIGNSKTGDVYAKQIFYYLCQYLLKGGGSGFLPKLDTFLLDTIPVDYLGEFTAHVTTDKNMRSSIFHTCAGHKHSTPLQTIRTMLLECYRAERGKPKNITLLPLPLYLKLIKIIAFFSSAKVKKEVNQLSFFLEYLKNSPKFANEMYLRQSKLYGIDIELPEVYLPNVLKKCV